MHLQDKFLKNTCRGNQSLAEKMLFVLWFNNNNFLYLKIRLKSYHHIFYQSHSFDLVRYILSKIVAMVTNHGYKKIVICVFTQWNQHSFSTTKLNIYHLAYSTSHSFVLTFFQVIKIVFIAFLENKISLATNQCLDNGT